MKMKANLFSLGSSLFLLVIVAISIASTGIVFARDEGVSDSTENGWVRIISIEDDFSSAVDFLKSSIEEEGLSIANEGNVSDMMSRTKDAVDGAELVYKNAMVFQFCSSKLGHKLFAIAPEAIGACPLSIFSYELKSKPGTIYMGYRRPPQAGNAALQKGFDEVSALLERVLKRAVE